MKCKIEGLYLIFTEYSQEELKELADLLTWEDSYNEKERYKSLLFTYGEGYYTFFGLYNELSKYINLELTSVERDDEIFEVGEVSENLLPGITLRPYQRKSIRKCCSLRFGASEIATGGGKSEIILGTAKIVLEKGFANKVLIITPSRNICTQFKERALKRGFIEDQIGMISGNNKEFDKPITVCVINSIASGLRSLNIKMIDFIKEVEALFYDEYHHFRADTQNQLAHYTSPKYLLGFSGTTFLSEDPLKEYGDAFILGLGGKFINYIPQKYLVDKGFLSEPVVFYKDIPGRVSKVQMEYNKVYKLYISENKVRNDAIEEYARVFNKFGLTTMISVERKNQARELISKLGDLKTVCLFGSETGVKINERFEQEEFKVDFNEFSKEVENGNYDIVISTQVSDEGVDFPEVGALILGGGNKSRIKMFQRQGRALRPKSYGENKCFIVDFMDRGHIYTLSQSKKRKKTFENAGVRIVGQEEEFIKELFRNRKE